MIHFLDSSGTFDLSEPQRTRALYFPLANEAGLVSSITPSLHGDVKTGHNTFLTPPVSIEDLHSSRLGRNFWVFIAGQEPWSAAGVSARQIAERDTAYADRTHLEAGLLWHKVIRSNMQVGLRAEITSFVPQGPDTVELMKITLVNESNHPLDLIPVAAIPLFARSADNLRDHRHVTSLLHRISTDKYGVWVQPTLSFDERGHHPNVVRYAVLGVEADGTAPQGFYPILAEFTGEAGAPDWPEALTCMQDNYKEAGFRAAGEEALGGLRFQRRVLQPTEQTSYLLVLCVLEQDTPGSLLVERYLQAGRFESWLEQTSHDWLGKVLGLEFHTGDETYNRWLKWVTMQPVLRRMIGNSFLPYHDYGRGGRGWRDLWQDCMALLLLEPDQAPELLYSSFAGVRFDGSNATIIGAKPGEFKADRNNIPRIWMDHGAWPFLTTYLYLQQSGDLGFLLRPQTYFKDQMAYRSRQVDSDWLPEQGNLLHAASGDIYTGTLLEHLLVQHLTSFYNVGDHNNLRLEDADWNDGMDMAPHKGESVAFSCLYAGNLRQLAELALELDRQGVSELDLAVELLPLLDTLGESRVNYGSVQAKQASLQAYLSACRHTLSGQKVRVPVPRLASDLQVKTDWMTEHIRKQEWISTSEGGWFNGYYDDDGCQVEGEFSGRVRMTLTGQVFALMCGIASEEQACQVADSADRYLLDSSIGGYRLNTDFGEVPHNLGRCFGFAYGHKENGAMFSHMDMMYANALYRCGMVEKGYQTLDLVYRQSMDFPRSRMYPGIPEYFDPQGRGCYPYLTGSAAWYLLTLLQESFGVKGRLGELVLEPKLLPEQFNRAGKASVTTLFAGKKLSITYHNPRRLNWQAYSIQTVRLEGTQTEFERSGAAVIIPRKLLDNLSDGIIHTIDVYLSNS